MELNECCVVVETAEEVFHEEPTLNLKDHKP